MLFPYPAQSLPGCLCCRWAGIYRTSAKTRIGGRAHVPAVHTEALAGRSETCRWMPAAAEASGDRILASNYLKIWQMGQYVTSSSTSYYWRRVVLGSIGSVKAWVWTDWVLKIKPTACLSCRCLLRLDAKYINNDNQRCFSLGSLWGTVWRHPQNRKFITYHNIVRRGLSDWGWATGNVHENLVKFGRVLFELWEQTEK